jgi:creatinine amidohydrolase/Fe(II)-dependent formamide hydrolase-like protein
LGNAIAAPVLPFSPNDASAELPGTIGITPVLFAEINERVAEQLIKSGFKNVVLMGDHGGGQKELKQVAESSTKSIPVRAFASYTAAMCIKRHRTISTSGARITGTDLADVPIFRIHRR